MESVSSYHKNQSESNHSAQGRLKAGANWASSHSRVSLNKIMLRIILTVKCCFRLYYTNNWEFQTVCQLAKCDDYGPRTGLGSGVLDESRSFFRVHTGYFSNIPKCIKAEFIASWGCSQPSVVSSSKR
ncbi:hypothetical protein TNCV_183311 [Trichonephila clavipes]|nr:hypothetical protein TNCV_183311 [Trichonephila clavipes]